MRSKDSPIPCESSSRAPRQPVSVTLIQPAAIDTPYPEHAKSYLGVEPKHTPPVYAPEVVARAILACAERPARNVLVGGGAKVLNTIERFAPKMGDRFKEASAEGQRSDRPARFEDTLFSPRPGDARVRGRYEGRVMTSSAYTSARLHRGRTLLGLAVVGAAVACSIAPGSSEARTRMSAADFIPARPTLERLREAPRAVAAATSGYTPPRRSSAKGPDTPR
jgi:hypothetical protein